MASDLSAICIFHEGYCQNRAVNNSKNKTTSDIFLFPSVLTLGRMTSMAEAVTILRAFHYNEIQNVDLSLLRDKGHGWSVLKALHLNINENEKKIATQEENMNCTFVHCTRSRSCFISVNSSAPHVYTCSSCRDTVYYLRSNKVRQGLSAGPKKQIQPLFSRRPARID